MRKPIGWTVAAVALAAVLVTGLVLGVRMVSSGKPPTATPECTVPVPASGGRASIGAATPVTVFLDAVQLQHAATINAVGMSRGLPERARIIALATAYQESQLRNLPNGDRDSVGLFQQRPSQGWGTAKQISDPVYAAGKFYDALVQVPGWQRMPLTEAAQAVQYSAFPDAYAKWEGQAATLAGALGGAAPLALTCIARAQAPTADAPARRAVVGAAGARPELAAVLSAAQAEMGDLTVVSVSGSRALVTLAIPGVGADQAGRALAAWAVAHGTGFAVGTVSVGGQRWADHAWTSTGGQLPPGQVSITTG